MDKMENELPADEEPLYNIGAVARMTGVPVATLRILERRCVFPRSARTAGGHRLYSEKEVTRLRWVKARGDEGMQTGQAIRALQHEERGGRLTDASRLAPPALRRKEDFSLGVTRERLVGALLDHDLALADQTIGEALAVHPLEDLVLDSVGPALADVGDAWMEGRATVATEHMATHYLRHRLLMWMEAGPPAFEIGPITLACAPGELHEGSLLLLGVLLRRRRWPVSYLGQSVPLASLAALLPEVKPSAVVLVAMLEESARELAEWPRWLGEAVQVGRPVIGFGGRIYSEQSEWREKGPGTFLGPTLQEGVENLERLLHETVALGI